MSAASPPRESFDGPLDLLLDEVRRQQIAIEDVALAPLVARYLDYLQSATRDNLPFDIDWILLAATLIHWKSRSLLAPLSNSPAGDPIRDEIVGLLLAHRKQLAADLDRNRSAAAGSLSRGGDPEVRDETQAGQDGDPPFISVWDLAQQARDLARWAAQRSQQRNQWRQAFLIEPEEATVSEMIAFLREHLPADGTPLDASWLLVEQPKPLAQVHMFLAMLEMAREQQLRILQAEEFSAIWLASLPPCPSE